MNIANRLFLIGILIVGLLASCNDELGKSDQGGPDQNKPDSKLDPSLNAFSLYMGDGATKNRINIGILFESPTQGTNLTGKEIDDYLKRALIGSHSLFSTAALKNYQNYFNIYYASISKSEDENYYSFSDEAFDAYQKALLDRKNNFITASTAEELMRVLNEAGQAANFNPEENTLFNYMNPLSDGVNLDNLDSIQEVEIINDPAHYTNEEIRWVFKRNYLRFMEVFDKKSQLDILVFASKGTSNYTYISPSDLNNKTQAFVDIDSFRFGILGVDEWARNFTHELGHSLGRFTDEYYEFSEDEGDSYVQITENCVSEGAVVAQGATGQVADQVLFALNDPLTNPWLQEFLPREVETAADDLRTVVYDVPGPVTNYTGSLYAGCAGAALKSYRSTEKSIMSHYYLFMNSDDWVNGFGPVHVHYMKYYMKNYFMLTL